MKETNWIVITGAPCSGKTKILERLSFLGYQVYPEVSRIIIDNLTSNNINLKDYLKDKERFENNILDLKFQLEKRTKPEDFYFFDRSIIDSYAFMKFYKVGNIKFENFLNFKYKKVFFIEPVPYENDKNRFEDQRQCEIIANNIKSAYRKYNYTLINVPLMPIDKRVELIIDKI